MERYRCAADKGELLGMIKFILGLLLGVISTITYYGYFENSDFDVDIVASDIFGMQVEESEIRRIKKSLKEGVSVTSDWASPMYAGIAESASEKLEGYCPNKGYSGAECSKAILMSMEKWIKKEEK